MLLGIGMTPSGILIAAVVALLLFGRRLPEVMRSLGKSVVEFKKGINESSDDKPSSRS